MCCSAGSAVTVALYYLTGSLSRSNCKPPHQHLLCEPTVPGLQRPQSSHHRLARHRWSSLASLLPRRRPPLGLLPIAAHVDGASETCRRGNCGHPWAAGGDGARRDGWPFQAPLARRAAEEPAYRLPTVHAVSRRGGAVRCVAWLCVAWRVGAGRGGAAVRVWCPGSGLRA